MGEDPLSSKCPWHVASLPENPLLILHGHDMLIDLAISSCNRIHPLFSSDLVLFLLNFVHMAHPLGWACALAFLCSLGGRMWLGVESIGEKRKEEPLSAAYSP